jgi:transcriptional regulator with XRE-family HTH domain
VNGDEKQKKTPEAVRAGQRILAVLKLVGITRRELANKTGLDYQRIGNYVQGTRELPIAGAQAIEAATKVPAAYVMGLIDDGDRELLSLPEATRRAFLEAVHTLSPGSNAPFTVTLPRPKPAKGA